MRGAIPPVPNTPSWRGAQLNHRGDLTFTHTHTHTCSVDSEDDYERLMRKITGRSGQISLRGNTKYVVTTGIRAEAEVLGIGLRVGSVISRICLTGLRKTTKILRGTRSELRLESETSRDAPYVCLRVVGNI